MSKIARSRSREYSRGYGALAIGDGEYAPTLLKTLDESVNDFINKDRDPDTNLIESSDFYHIKTTSDVYYYNRPNRGGDTLHGKAAAIVNKTAAPNIGWHNVAEDKTKYYYNLYVAKLLARTSPNRPIVSVPVMVFELVETITLLRLNLSTLTTLWSSAHLQNTFGWSPFLSDIKALSKITKSIESRIREYNSLLGKHGLARTKVALYRNQVTDRNGPYGIDTTGSASLYAYAHNTHRLKVWGSVRWFPKEPGEIPVEPIAQFNKALKVVLDLEVLDSKELDRSTVWEIIPFSWAVDYFVNIQEALLAREATMEFDPRHICIMEERLSTNTYQGWINNRPDVTSTPNSSAKTITKQQSRWTYNYTSGGPLVNFSFFSETQAINLIALGISLATKRAGLKTFYDKWLGR